MRDKHILIVGAGSIGRRHLRNLQTLGMQQITVCDPDAKSRTETGCRAYADFTEALAAEHLNIVFLCSPTRLHVPQALAAVRANAHVFIEKPLSHTMESIEELQREVEERECICMVGCNMRFHPGPAKVKELMDTGVIGKAKQATVYTGSYLPDWRPQQDYKKSYSADPAQGGAILDCIHEIDLALWFLGPATLTGTQVKPATSIGLAVEGTADLTLRHAGGRTSAVHLSFIEKKYRRFCTIIGTEGSIHWDFGEERVVIRDRSDTETATYPTGGDINRMYMEEISHFLHCCEKHCQPPGNMAEARAALEIALEARNA